MKFYKIQEEFNVEGAPAPAPAPTPAPAAPVAAAPRASAPIAAPYRHRRQYRNYRTGGYPYPYPVPMYYGYPPYAELELTLPKEEVDKKETKKQTVPEKQAGFYIPKSIVIG